MKVFISWSGDVSRAVAVALREWLPLVLQIVEPYVSSEDIEKGARWSAEVAQQLNETAFGVLCVTASNVGSPWLNFEAGALSKSIDTSRVSPFLLDLRPTELIGPLAQFQATLPQLDDITRLLKSINSATGRPIDETLLIRSVDMWWPELEERLNAIRGEQVPVKNNEELRAWYELHRSYAGTAANRLRNAVVSAFLSLAAVVLVMLLV
jgi:TIR domain